jgi:hypothetical protein
MDLDASGVQPAFTRVRDRSSHTLWHLFSASLAPLLTIVQTVLPRPLRREVLAEEPVLCPKRSPDTPVVTLGREATCANAH